MESLKGECNFEAKGKVSKYDLLPWSLSVFISLRGGVAEGEMTFPGEGVFRLLVGVIDSITGGV